MYKGFVCLAALLLVARGAGGFKLRALGASRERPAPPPPDDGAPKVLVVGATGRVGKHVVHGLLDRGYSVVCLSRDTDSEEARRLKRYARAEVVRGDLLDPVSLEMALQGCTACISCTGSSRLTRLSDLWTRPDDLDWEHPFMVNYVGTQNLIDAAHKAGVRRIVRVTGLSVGYTPFHPVPALLNALVSMTVASQLRCELALRASGLDYTIIRPGALDDKDPAPNDLDLLGDGQPLKVGRVSRKDVAGLCMAALEVPQTCNATISCVRRADSQATQSLVAGSRPEAEAVLGPEALVPYKAILRKAARRDVSQLRPKPHRLAVALLCLAVTTVLWSVGTAAKAGLAMALRALRRPKLTAKGVV